MMENICVVCRKKESNGIIIKGNQICNHCEKKIIHCDVNTDFYNYYKKIIQNNIVPKIQKSFL